MDFSKCTCWITPFTPAVPCFDYCTGRILKLAKQEELITLFNLPEKLAEKIYTLTSDDSLQQLSQFKNLLEPSEYALLTDHFNHISDQAQTWIRTEFRKRINAREEMYA